MMIRSQRLAAASPPFALGTEGEQPFEARAAAAVTLEGPLLIPFCYYTVIKGILMWLNKRVYGCCLVARGC